MNQRLATSRQSGVVSLAAAIVGLGLLVALVFSLNALFASRTPQSSQTISQYQAPSVQPLSLTPTITISQEGPTDRWKTYEDPEYSVALKQPPGWKLTTTRRGEYLYLFWLDPVAQDQPLGATEITRGAFLLLQARPYESEQPLSEFFSKQAQTESVTMSAMAVRNLEGIRRLRISDADREELFSFLRPKEDQMLLYTFALHVADLPAAKESGRADEYLQVFAQALNSIQFINKQ